MAGRPWTLREIRKLQQLYPERHARDVAQVLRRSTNSILAKAARLGIEKSPSFIARVAYESGKRLAQHQGNKLWSDDERSQLAALFPVRPNSDLARIFHCSEKAVRDQAHIIGVKKSVFGALAWKRGVEGEEKAKDFFLQHGFRILETGKNRGGHLGWDAYDYIVESPQGTRIVVNVKYAHNSLQIKPMNLQRLFRLRLPVAFLLMTNDDMFWADVRNFP